MVKRLGSAPLSPQSDATSASIKLVSGNKQQYHRSLLHRFESKTPSKSSTLNFNSCVGLKDESPSSVLEIAGNVKAKESLHLNKSRDRVHSFLRKKFNGSDGSPLSPSSPKSPRGVTRSPVRTTAKQLAAVRHRQLKQQTEKEKPKHIPNKQVYVSDFEASSSSDTTAITSCSSTSGDGPESSRYVDYDDTDNSLESDGSLPSSLGSGGIIGIQRPNYSFPADSYGYLPPAPPSLSPPPPSPPRTLLDHPSAGFQSPATPVVITPKRKYTPTLAVDTSRGLAAVCEAEESDSDASSVEERQEEEVVFGLDEEKEGVDNFLQDSVASTQNIPNNNSGGSLFDDPWNSSECNEEEEVDIPFTVDEQPKRTEPSQSEVDIRRETMFNYFRARKHKSVALSAAISPATTVTADDSTTKSISSKVSDTPSKRKSRDKTKRHSLKSTSEHSVKSSATSKSKPKEEALNKVFLLLLEPQSKMFELIQLLYPIRTTTIHDIIKMIPKNATEQELADQTYTGLTRPKKRAQPIADLNLLASMYVRSLGNGNLEEVPSAGIGQGDVIVAIPEGCDQKTIINLSKQILANPHIGKLVGRDEKDKKKKKKEKHRSRSRDKKSKKSNKKDMSPSKKKSYLRKDSESPRRRLRENEIPKQLDLDIAKETVDNNGDVADRYDQEMQRAIELAALANTRKEESPYNTPPSSVCKVISGQLQNPEIFDATFPQVGGLDAFLLAREERSSSITSRETRTTLEDTVDTNDYTYRDNSIGETVEDDSSIAGSLETSFNSWSRSLDTSMASRYSMRRKKRHAQAVTLRDETAEEENPSTRLRRKRLAKNMLRFMACTTFFMVTRYLLDTENGYAATKAVENRALTEEEPMGWVGFCYLLLSFTSLWKLQRFMQKKTHTSKCPIMQAGYDLYEVSTAYSKDS